MLSPRQSFSHYQSEASDYLSVINAKADIVAGLDPTRAPLSQTDDVLLFPDDRSEIEQLVQLPTKRGDANQEVALTALAAEYATLSSANDQYSIAFYTAGVGSVTIALVGLRDVMRIWERWRRRSRRAKEAAQAPAPPAGAPS